jgi:hypothetical protein
MDPSLMLRMLRNLEAPVAPSIRPHTLARIQALNRMSLQDIRYPRRAKPLAWGYAPNTTTGERILKGSRTGPLPSLDSYSPGFLTRG